MSTAPTIGTIASKTDKLFVQRQGEQLTLQQGDAILAGDVLQNKDVVSIDIELPAQASGQADSLVTLAPESVAQISSDVTTGNSMIEVTSLTEGVELFAISEGTDGAVLLADASGASMNGLVGTGLLATGGSLGSVSGIATAVGAGAGVVAVAASSGDDTTLEGSTFTDVRVDNGDETTEPVDNPENPDENENPTGPETPENPEGPLPPAANDPISALIGVIDDVLVGTPLEPLSDVLGMVTEALPIGSAPNPADALPLDAITGNLPT